MDFIPLTALLISVVAIIVSGLAALYTRRQARAAEGVLEIERQREHEERRPEVIVEFAYWRRSSSSGSRDDLFMSIENRGVRVVDRVLIRPAKDWGDSFYVSKDEPPVPKFDFGPLYPNAPIIVEFGRGYHRPDEPHIRFLVEYRHGDDEWDDVLDLPLPDRHKVLDS